MEFKWVISQMDCKIKETIDGQEVTLPLPFDNEN
jgi:hypothetical protein